MVYCCVVGCSSDSRSKDPGLRFFNFPWKYPFQTELREQWILAINRRNSDGSLWQPQKNSVICNKHFVDGKRSTIWQHPSSVPSMFPEAKAKKLKSAKRSCRQTSKCKKVQLDRSLDEDSSESSCDAIDVMIEEKLSKDVSTQVYAPEENSELFAFIADRHSATEMSLQCSIPFDSSDSLGTNDMVEDPRFLGFTGFSSLATDQQLLSLCGVNFEVFNLFLKMINSRLSAHLDNETVLLMFLTKLKTALPCAALSVFFQVDRSTVSESFQSTLSYLCKQTENFVEWPCKRAVRNALPESFRELQPNARVIIDCLEIKCELSDSVHNRAMLYSDRKEDYTIKVLLGITLNGYICFKSNAYGGAASDTFIVTDSGFLNILEPDDVILANREFPGVDSIVVLPRFLGVAEDTEMVDLRLHVESCISRVKHFKLMHTISKRLLPLADDIVHICCVLANLMGPIVED